uniref:Uncharacterized protein n=1 Tax=Tanacetum cinerariifolium TaxID=118510 RepID=A0A6L2KBG9_TANCI|nr:hypothetical protein [Tanacetum cinerariifolium]
MCEWQGESVNSKMQIQQGRVNVNDTIFLCMNEMRFSFQFGDEMKNNSLLLPRSCSGNRKSSSTRAQYHYPDLLAMEPRNRQSETAVEGVNGLWNCVTETGSWMFQLLILDHIKQVSSLRDSPKALKIYMFVRSDGNHITFPHTPNHHRGRCSSSSRHALRNEDFGFA